jgi:hypothetical protein
MLFRRTGGLDEDAPENAMITRVSAVYTPLKQS